MAEHETRGTRLFARITGAVNITCWVGINYIAFDAITYKTLSGDGDILWKVGSIVYHSLSLPGIVDGIGDIITGEHHYLGSRLVGRLDRLRGRRVSQSLE